MWKHGDLLQATDKFGTVSVVTEQGMTWYMFDNPHLAPKLAALGLRRETAFACVMDYLVTLKPSVQQRFAHHVHQALQPSGTDASSRILRVGIQIRTGDGSMRGGEEQVTGEQLLKQYEAFFECAQQITDTRGAGYSRVVWYLVTDSAPLRRAAVKKLGSNRLITDLTHAPKHISDHTAR
jgi:hypothetical protein